MKPGIIKSMLYIRVSKKIGDDRHSMVLAAATDETGYYRQHPLYKNN
jgi:hypothetical protein